MSKTSDSAERAPFEMTRQALHFMRIAACMAVVLLIICCVEEWRFPLALAPEARAYQGDYPDALRGGLNGSYAIGHLALLCGFIAGCVGVVLVCCKNRRGLAPLTASAPLIAFGASLFTPGPAYPSLEPIYLVILWCSASAAWASAVTLGFLCLKN